MPAKTYSEVSAPDIQPFLDHWDGKVSFAKDRMLKVMDLPAIWDGTEWITEEISPEEFYDLTEYKTWQDLVEKTMPDRQADMHEVITVDGGDPETDFFFGPYRDFRAVVDLSAVPDPFDSNDFVEEF